MVSTATVPTSMRASVKIVWIFSCFSSKQTRSIFHLPGTYGYMIKGACNVSLVPRLSWNANMYRAESLVSFLRKHDVIKIGPEQKGNILPVVQPTMS